ncbi:hypothetical protein COT48_04380 [Candidatus Woesearchaeota archaeon CG08_land_8_20_14_0_20_47_9]|nr:MAG: hypothetical protein COT48_04380 [Candidatus Woesearchaeota archaeon CG08_land_8_20_14_0_20_47_9]HII29832.1 hypothetical protein [Candidatus Woesearchaeota archaeon]
MSGRSIINIKQISKASLISMMLFLSACTYIQTGMQAEPPSEDGSITAYFCPQDNCTGVFISFIDSAESSIHCAFYYLRKPEIVELLDQKSRQIDVRVVVERDNNNLNYPWLRVDTSSAYMHNKFCVADASSQGMNGRAGKPGVYVGSTDAMLSAFESNINNFLIIESNYVAADFEGEFEELWSGVYGGGGQTPYPKVLISSPNGNALVDVLFCPEDGCSDALKRLIDNADQEINFEAFSFTLKSIADALVNAQSRGVKVSGIFEYQQKSQYSQHDSLKARGLNVTWDNLREKLHSKVFIIDDTVVTGSFNPSMNGDTRNDESVVVVHNKELAEQYRQGFYGVWNDQQNIS